MKIIYFMGKSASGKDTIYRKVKEKTDRSGDVVSGWTSAAGRKNIRCAH